MQEETRLKNSILRMVKKEFPEVFIVKTADMFLSGLPDLIGCQSGQFIAMEIKTATGRVTPLQKIFIEKINAAGGRACVVRSVDETRNFLRAEKKEPVYCVLYGGTDPRSESN